MPRSDASRKQGRHGSPQPRAAGHRDGGPAAPKPGPARVEPGRRTDDSWLYGRHAIAAALANPRRSVRRLLALPEAAAAAGLLLAAARARRPATALPEIVTRETLAAILPAGAVHQGLALDAAPLPTPDLEDILEGPYPAAAAPHVIVLLDQVSDPHNVGAVLRSAAAFGARAVIVPEHGAPAISGTLAKAASGALEHVPLVRVVNLARALDRLKTAGFWCLGLDAAAGQTLGGGGLGERLALVLGAEGDGLRRLTRERCDLLLRLPTRGAITSLNVSNAAAIALYELTRGSTASAPSGCEP